MELTHSQILKITSNHIHHNDEVLFVG